MANLRIAGNGEQYMYSSKERDDVSRALCAAETSKIFTTLHNRDDVMDDDYDYYRRTLSTMLGVRMMITIQV